MNPLHDYPSTTAGAEELTPAELQELSGRLDGIERRLDRLAAAAAQLQHHLKIRLDNESGGNPQKRRIPRVMKTMSCPTESMEFIRSAQAALLFGEASPVWHRWREEQRSRMAASA